MSYIEIANEQVYKLLQLGWKLELGDSHGFKFAWRSPSGVSGNYFGTNDLSVLPIGVLESKELKEE